jgi:hypothetical protein
MSPSLIGSLEIRDITLGDGPVPLASIGRLYLEYSLWDLIRGRGAGAIRNLVRKNPNFPATLNGTGISGTCFLP